MKNFVLKNEVRTKVFGNPNRLLSHETRIIKSVLVLHDSTDN